MKWKETLLAETELPRNKRSDECSFGGLLDETPTKMVAAPGEPKSYSEERWLLVLLQRWLSSASYLKGRGCEAARLQGAPYDTITTDCEKLLMYELPVVTSSTRISPHVSCTKI
jgi:hypothetical protein